MQDCAANTILMGNNYIFSLTPTFTQGLVLGQLSILVLLVLVLKYLFFVPPNEVSETPTFQPLTKPDYPRSPIPGDEITTEKDSESANWFNLLARQVCHHIFSQSIAELEVC